MANKDINERIERLNSVSDIERELMMLYFDDVDAIFRLAEQGNATAQTKLGVMYSEGKGVEQSYSKALHWYTLAAEAGNYTAQNNLAIMYSDGLGVEQDQKKAVELYKKSAESGNKVPLYNLAQYYLSGEVVGTDYEEARRLLKLSAQQGYKPAIEYARKYKYDVGELFEFKYSDVFQWYKNAAAKGDSEAKAEYHKMLREGMGTLEERIAQIGEPPYDKDAEKSLAEILKRRKSYSREKSENIAYTLYKKMRLSPDIETYEKMLATGHGNKYEGIYDLIKDSYVKAVNENRYIGMILGSDVTKVEQALAAPDPKPDITHNKWFAIAAVALLPAILTALFVKSRAALGVVFLLLPVISVLILRHARKPYDPLVQVHTAKKAAVDSFISKYGTYINIMYNRTNVFRSKPQSLVKYKNGELNYIATYYSRCKMLLDRYQAMEFITPATTAKSSRKSKGPKSRI